jgi:uncharacterized protein YaeQ
MSNAASTQALAGLAARKMDLQCLVQDGLVQFSDETRTVDVGLTLRLAGG